MFPFVGSAPSTLSGDNHVPVAGRRKRKGKRHGVVASQRKSNGRLLPLDVRIAVVGRMLGRHPGYVTTQGQILSDLFQRDGYSVLDISPARSRTRWLLDVAMTLIRRWKTIDLLFIEVYGGPSFVVEDLASWLGRFFGLPIVMELHGGAMPTFVATFPRWTRRVLARADALVVPSPFLERAIASEGFRAHIVPNVVDLGLYPYRPRRVLRPRLLWMRTFDDIYNPAMALRAFAQLRQLVPDATLVMAGQDNGLESSIRELTRTLGVEAGVRFAGFLSHDRKVAEADNADIFLNTNRVDNTPVTVLEACAMGLPVVATRVGGIPDLLTHEHTGLLVPDGDHAAMARAVQRLLDEPAVSERLSANGHALALRSSWDHVRSQWHQIFVTTVGKSVSSSKGAP